MNGTEDERPRAWQRVIASALLLLSSISPAAAGADAAPSPSGVGESLRARVEVATDLFRTARHAPARALFDALVDEPDAGPLRGTLAFNAAVCSFALEEYADAQRRFEDVARSHSELAALARVNAGFAALAAGDLRAAASHAGPTPNASADIERRRQQLLTQLAKARLEQRQRERRALIDSAFAALAARNSARARAELSRALELADDGDTMDLADIHYGLGIAALESGEAVSARSHFEESLKQRPHDAQTLFALGRAAEDAGDRELASTAYERALAGPSSASQADSAERALDRLHGLPRVGTAAFIALSAGHDDNANQSGSTDRTGGGGGIATASPYLSGLMDLELTLHRSGRHAAAVAYSADVLALLDAEAEASSLQVQELVGRWSWAPTPKVRLRLDAGAAYLSSGLSPVRSLEWNGIAALAADVETGARSRARLQLRESLVRGAELRYLDGHRLDLLAAELWDIGAWQLSVQGSFRYNDAGVQELALEPEAFEPCAPDCDDSFYQNAVGYWGAAIGTGASVRVLPALRLAARGRAEYRRHEEPSGVAGFPESMKVRQDTRLQTRVGLEIPLDTPERWCLMLHHTVLVNVSNVAFDAEHPAHQLDYGNRNFTQQLTELGISASIF